MKVILMALIVGCAVGSTAFAHQTQLIDIPGSHPPQVEVMDIPGSHPPQLEVMDIPGSHPPQVEVTDIPGSHPPQITWAYGLTNR